MNDLEKRVTDLENKVKILEETLETLKNMNLSEQMEGYIKKRSQTLKMADLLNAVSDKPAFDLSKEEAQIENIQRKKNDLNEQIAKAIADSEKFTDDYSDDSSYFNYEIENGIENNDSSTISALNSQKNVEVLLKYKNKGIRITGYNGFDNERVIIPREIDGMPVVCIGEKAFMNAEFKEIIIPNSVKAILNNAFCGCSKLKKLSIPEGVVYLGDSCFKESGIEEFDCPRTISVIPSKCFYYCDDLHKFHGGQNIRIIKNLAFSGCKSLLNFNFSEALETIEWKSFSDTGTKIFIIPANTKIISSQAFEGWSLIDKEITLVILGKETEIKTDFGSRLYNVCAIYCESILKFV